MQVKEIKSEGLNRELEITVPLKEIEGHVETRLKDVGRKVKIQGFRPGKVPMNILKKRYGRAVLGEVLELAVNQSSAKAMKERNIRPAGQPKIEVKEFDEGKDLTYKMEVEVLPDIKLMDFSSLSLEKPVAKPNPTSVEETLQRLADNSRASKKIEDDRATKKGDIVVIDFHGRTKDDGVAHEGMHAHGHKLELGSGQFIPGFEDQLIGKKAGMKVEVEVTFPENYGASELAGREAIFDVEIHEIHETEPGKIDDELAKRMGYDTVQALREAVEHQTQHELDQQSRMKLKRALLDQLDEAHAVEAPKRMAEAEYESILQQIERERQMQKDEESLSDEEKEELKEIAGRRVRLGLVLSEVGNKENIKVTNQELQQGVIREAQKYPGQEKLVFEFYQKNPQALESLRAPIFEEKVVEFILGKAKISEKSVSAEDLMKDDEEENRPKKKEAPKKKSSSKAKK